MKYPRLQSINSNENNVDIPYGLKKANRACELMK